MLFRSSLAARSTLGSRLSERTRIQKFVSKDAGNCQKSEIRNQKSNQWAGNAANQAQQAVGEFTQMRGLAGRETSGLAPAGLKTTLYDPEKRITTFVGKH